MSGQILKPKPTVTLNNDLSHVHILVAEDEPINLFVVIKMLEAKNASVSQASNGMQVIEMLQKGLQPDIILLDINMPGMNGYDTIGKIKEVNKDFVVLAFTASIIDPDTERKLQEKGFDGTIAKPFDPEMLYKKILSAQKKSR